MTPAKTNSAVVAACSQIALHPIHAAMALKVQSASNATFDPPTSAPCLSNIAATDQSKPPPNPA